MPAEFMTSVSEHRGDCQAGNTPFRADEAIHVGQLILVGGTRPRVPRRLIHVGYGQQVVTGGAPPLKT